MVNPGDELTRTERQEDGRDQIRLVGVAGGVWVAESP